MASGEGLGMMHPPRTLTSSEQRRLLAGLIVQPFVSTGLALFGFPVFLLDRNGRTLAGGVPANPTEAALSVALGTGLVALCVTVVGVLPTALWLSRRRQLSLGETLLVGLGFGNLPYVLLAIAAGGTYGIAGLVRGVAFSSLLGVAGAAAFWAIVFRRQS
jgi:hypothetical protein